MAREWPVNIRLNDLLGDRSERATPVPIPNTAVKPLSPDGTARATVWESRKSPESKTKNPGLWAGFFVFEAEGGGPLADGWRERLTAARKAASWRASSSMACSWVSVV